MSEVIKSGRTDRDARDRLRQSLALWPWPLADVDAEIDRMLTPASRHLLTFDPKVPLGKIDCPVQVINGGRDIVVDPHINGPIVFDTLKSNGNRNVTAVTIAGINHALRNCRTGASNELVAGDEIVVPAVTDSVARWLGDLPAQRTVVGNDRR
jgi:fermentation-respiration switch protein FrsA (DUF1100 family)